MSPENANHSPEYDTQLTLGLPGSGDSIESLTKSGRKRAFLETVDLNFHQENEHDALRSTKTKAQVVGWPPVREFRKNVLKSCCKYVKVAVDGAPYLRKVDLQIYSNYLQLLSAVEHMFSCLTIRNYLNKRKIMDNVNGVEYVPTYEDKDGDWMLVGDVPWKMFIESCKRIRLMKSSAVIGLAPPKNSSTT